MLRRRRSPILAVTLVVFLGVVATACGGSSGSNSSATTSPGRTAATEDVSARTVSLPVHDIMATPKGVERLHLEVGPIPITPGQNSISFSRRIAQPAQDGWIVGMTANLRLADGSIPPVDVIHLHHGVWLNLSHRDATSGLPERFFAAGEEKTAMQLPAGYGYPYKTSDKWLLNYMLHNQLSKPNQVWVTYDLNFIPADSPAAQGIKAAFPVWMDVENPSAYPVFDVIKGRGHDGEYTFPTDAKDPYGGRPARNEWTVPEDGVLLGTGGHLHPGGLHNDLYLTRSGAKAPGGHAMPGTTDTVRLFTSQAKYWEPAGDVSWDLSMSVTPPGWMPEVHKGDTLSITTTYESTNSWYESMGIMVVWMSTEGSGTNPFTAASKVDAPGVLTHGHLAENDNHGGAPAPGKYEDLTKLPSRVVPSGAVLPIADFAYEGDMSAASSVPTVVEGGSLTFRNDDASQNIWHTITDCAAPCDRSTGIAYPLANGAVRFDSGELGFGRPPAAGRNTWSTPTNLPPGTYTYFCRIHPFMRGAFRVIAPTSG